MHRTTEAVARSHLDAVRSGDPVAMAADYAVEAELHRPGGVIEGHEAIEAYFRAVPARLGPAEVVFDSLVVDGETATFRWHLEGADVTASGTDVLTIRDGLIVRQVVELDGPDF